MCVYTHTHDVYKYLGADDDDALQKCFYEGTNCARGAQRRNSCSLLICL